ncbi:PREDICTED: uncharacterized protein LOC109168280 [Ipomoea nil]|uniref:uncharacterized protein LOC109168280 n=1 Tax=Ipomoea nil TaxID=35883 RepID=UPI000901AB9E|nr:PREDICTED: uncharacterized protein LOC109168280 [Ipomoea nil]
MEKSVTGKHVRMYIGKAATLICSVRTKKWPAQKEIKMAAIEVKRQLSPSSSFLGRLFLKSFCWQREVRIARKKTRAVTEKPRAMSDETANASKAGWPLRMGRPVLSSTPPGMVADVANATVAISAAMTEQELEVVTSHLVPLLALHNWLKLVIHLLWWSAWWFNSSRFSCSIFWRSPPSILVLVARFFLNQFIHDLDCPCVHFLLVLNFPYPSKS